MDYVLGEKSHRQPQVRFARARVQGPDARSLRRLVTRVLRWEAPRPTGMPKEREMTDRPIDVGAGSISCE